LLNYPLFSLCFKFVDMSEFNDKAYMVSKHTESAYALLQAASLPYEAFAETSEIAVPSLFPGPEAQLTDTITTEVRVDPLLNGFIELSCEPMAPLYMTIGEPMLPTSDDAGGSALFQFNGPGAGTFLGGDLEIVSAKIKSLGGGLAEFPLIIQTAFTGTFRLIRKRLKIFPTFNANIEYTFGGGVWLPVGVSLLFDEISVNINLGTLPVGVVALRIVLESVYPFYGQQELELAFQPDSGTYLFPNAWSTLKASQWPFIKELPPSEAFRRIACDLLVTWTGSTLDNGGKIASALVPAPFSPTLNPYDSVASLRADRYDGPVKTGTSVTWRPSSYADYDRMNVGNFSRASLKLVCGYNFAVSSGSARLRAFGMFGFTSHNPIIGRQLWTTVITPAMMEALAIYWQTHPACTSNAEHKFLKALKGVGKFGLKTLMEQDDKLAALAMAMGQPEIAAAVKGGATLARNVKASRQAKKSVALPNVVVRKSPK
jgi:hypothetical protein